MKNREDISKALLLVWDSLESHLDYVEKCEKQCESCGTPSFHRKAIREYGFVIKVLTEQL